MNPTIAIIGAGISGVSAANALIARASAVTLSFSRIEDAWLAGTRVADIPPPRA